MPDPTPPPSGNAPGAQTPAPDASVRQTATPKTPQVIRRRSTHHRHHHHAHLDSPERLRRKEDIKALFFIMPGLLLGLGALLWFLSSLENDSSLRPKDLLQLSYTLMGIGGALFIFALIRDWVLRARRAWRDRIPREKSSGGSSGSTVTIRRRRSTHHVHRHHHTDED